MNHWLVKSDPDAYSAKDLERDRRTIWDGVSNALALLHIRAMAKGDRVMIYHSGKEKAVVAVAKVASAPRPDAADSSGKRFVVDLAFDYRLERPIPLKVIKADHFFQTFDLVRISRLSVMPVTPEQWQRLLDFSV